MNDKNKEPEIRFPQDMGTIADIKEPLSMYRPIRVDTQAEKDFFFAIPSKIPNSKYHELITKDQKLSNLEKWDVEIIMEYHKLLGNLIWFGSNEVKNMVHAELNSFLISKSAMAALERRLQALPQTPQMYQPTQSTVEQERRRWFK